MATVPGIGMLECDRAVLFFFDLAVTNASAGIQLSADIAAANPGPLFEQWVGIELWNRLMYAGRGRLHYFRTKDGPEIDYIVELGETCVPIEVKWTEHPARSDAKHLAGFMKKQPAAGPKGFVACRWEYPMEITENITAIPYWYL